MTDCFNNKKNVVQPQSFIKIIGLSNQQIKTNQIFYSLQEQCSTSALLNILSKTANQTFVPCNEYNKLFRQITYLEYV